MTSSVRPAAKRATSSVPLKFSKGKTTSFVTCWRSGGSDDAGEVTTFDVDGDFEVTASIVIDDETLDETVMVHAYANRD